MKRFFSIILVFVLCCSFLTPCASAQTVSTEELLFRLVDYLLSGAQQGIEVELEQPSGEQNSFLYIPNGIEGASLSVLTPDTHIGLDAAGAYIQKDDILAGLTPDEVKSFLLRESIGLSRLPRFSEEDGALFIDLMTSLWTSIAQNALQFDESKVTSASGNTSSDETIQLNPAAQSILTRFLSKKLVNPIQLTVNQIAADSGKVTLKIDLDKLAVSTNAAIDELLTTRSADIDALLGEYGELLNILIRDFPQSAAELQNLLDMLNLSTLQTGITLTVSVAWMDDSWQMDGEALGWKLHAAWENEAFVATLSPDESLSADLPTYTIDSRDAERLSQLVTELLYEIPGDALYFASHMLFTPGGTSPEYQNYAFHLDTFRLKQYFLNNVPVYLQAHEAEISTLIEKYMPFLTLLSSKAERWSDMRWLSNQLYLFVSRLPNFKTSVELTEQRFDYRWHLNASFNDYQRMNYALSLSFDAKNNISVMLSSTDSAYGYFENYTLDGRLTKQGGEIVCGMNQNGNLQQLTLRFQEENDHYLVEAYTTQNEYYASLRIYDTEIKLDVLGNGESIATGTLRMLNEYIYIDFVSDALTLDGTLTGGNGFSLSLLVNGTPITFLFEQQYFIQKFTYRSPTKQLDASWGNSGARLYMSSSTDGFSFLAECLPYQEKYSLVLNEGWLNSASEYGFAYTPGRLDIMGGTWKMRLSDVSAWVDNCLNAVDFTLMQSEKQPQSLRVITHQKDDFQLEANVYIEGSAESALTVRVNLKPDPLPLPYPEQWLTTDEFLSLLQE